MKCLCYLAGPITGLSYDGATDWRDDAAKLLDGPKISRSLIRGLPEWYKQQLLAPQFEKSSDGEAA